MERWQGGSQVPWKCVLAQWYFPSGTHAIQYGLPGLLPEVNEQREDRSSADSEF